MHPYVHNILIKLFVYLTWVSSKECFFMSTVPKEVLREMITGGNLRTAGDL